MVKRGAVEPAVTEALEAQGIHAPDNGNGGSGNHKQGPGAGAWGEGGAISGLIKEVELPSITREFLHAGKDVEDLLGRAIFVNKEEAQIWDLLLDWAEEFSCEDAKKFIKRVVSSYNSIGGYSRDQALQIGTQTLRSFNYPGVDRSKGDKQRQESQQKQDNGD